MAKNLQKRSEFAKLAGVAPSAITRQCRPGKPLAAACVGKRIDADHPAAVAYVESQQRPSWDEEIAQSGTDPLYADAVEACQRANRWAAEFITEELGITRDRGRVLARLIRAAGAHGRPAPPDDPPPPKPLKPRPRGQAAVKEAKKRAPPVDPAGTGEGGADAVEIPPEIQAFADMPLRELVRRFGSDVRFLEWLKAVEKLEVIEARRLKNAETAGRLVARDLVVKAVIDPFTSAHLRLISDGAKTIAAGAASKARAGAELQELEVYVADVIGSFLKPVKAKVARGLRDV